MGNKSHGEMDVDYADLTQKRSGRAVLVICGSGKKVGVRLDRGAAGYLFGQLAEFLKHEESGVAQLKRELSLENR